jgi:type IV pilus assembly protein PilQ
MNKKIREWILSVLLSAALVCFAFDSVALCSQQQENLADNKGDSALKRRVSYSCTDKPIDEVLMALADQAGVDIVKSPQVIGNVTVKVTDIPLEEALANILAANNYTYVATENMIRVMPVPQLAAFEEQLVTRIYQLTYADANQVAAALSNFISQKGKVALNRGTSHIMVTDTQDKIRGIDSFIQQIDKRTPQVLVEVRIYDVTSKEGFELEPNWYLGRNTPLETTESQKTNTATSVNSQAPTSLTRTDITEVVGEGEMPFSGQDAIVTVGPGEVVQYLPNEYRSYSTEDRTVETRTEEILNPDGYSNVKAVDKETTRSTMRKRKPFVSGSFDREIGGSINFSLLNDAIDLDFVLTMLHSQLETKLLANPRVLVLDNQTANFQIIREVPYRELRQVAREDPITYTAFKDVGVQLKVTPHIARDGIIKLHIAPEFGILVSQDIYGVPTVDTRRADTIALIEDGQTIVLGGLRQKKTTKDISKVPLFGDMPLVGGLFKAESESVVTSELVIFITTKIIDKSELTADERQEYDLTNITSPQISPMRLEAGRKTPKTITPTVSEKSEQIQVKDANDMKEISDILKKLLNEQ